jgi:hypothetical protein
MEFPGIVQDDETDMLGEQFSDYQLAPVDDLSSCVTDDNMDRKKFISQFCKLN